MGAARRGGRPTGGVVMPSKARALRARGLATTLCRRWLRGVVGLSAVLTACGVTLPPPPPATTEAERLCVLECQAQHTNCLNDGPSPYLTYTTWSADRLQRACADQLATCYRTPCAPAPVAPAPPSP